MRNLNNFNAIDFIATLPIEDVSTIKRVSYSIPQCATQVMCGTKDGVIYTAHVTPTGSRFVQIIGVGVYKLNKLTRTQPVAPVSGFIATWKAQHMRTDPAFVGLN